ncbi:DUF4408 domain-containing protein [Caenorhabditis elegans]|uniref:DUF4408 domain-containing protein n=1 Tax=Caenorhabditis elegans TaxID=6239 RepID=Q4TT87_CAEEL|nr:DUF4408 domain-containing protein [Caenorhabditis elegans]CCD69265.1 DUF4408 domain-containing protein [Caenorhabditis elegans]|eukprot:NP_001022076.1 Uncharacterized protein CELE_F11G11.14 [Caenorhabditis elegans]
MTISGLAIIEMSLQLFCFVIIGNIFLTCAKKKMAPKQSERKPVPVAPEASQSTSECAKTQKTDKSEANVKFNITTTQIDKKADEFEGDDEVNPVALLPVKQHKLKPQAAAEKDVKPAEKNAKAAEKDHKPAEKNARPMTPKAASTCKTQMTTISKVSSMNKTKTCAIGPPTSPPSPSRKSEIPLFVNESTAGASNYVQMP